MNKFLITKLVTNYSKITLRIIFTSDLPESTDNFRILHDRIERRKKSWRKKQLGVKGGEQMGWRLKNLGKN